MTVKLVSAYKNRSCVVSAGWIQCAEALESCGLFPGYPV